MPIYITNYSYSPAILYPIDNARPAEYDYDIEVISDLSGEDITDEVIWQIDDGDVCSEEEMLEHFNDEYVSDVTDEKEYQKGKEWLIKVFNYEEEDFENHPQIIKIKVPYGKDEYQYDLKDNFDPIETDCLPQNWRQLDDDDLERIGFDNM